jgi:hypothetical protein
MSNVTIVAKTFLQSVASLESADIARLEGFLNRLQAAPNSPGLGFERIDGAADDGFWAARVNKDMSAVIHQNDDRYTLLFIGPNADATNWAKQHRVQVHSVTGATQVVPIPDPNVLVQNHDPTSETFLDFARFDTPFLMSLGIPSDWVELVQKISDEETFFSVYEKMPEEAAEYLYSLALGEDVTPPTPVAPTLPPQHNEDNLRRLYVLDEGETLSAVLSRPFEQWMLFLHPSQRSLVSQQFNGPSKITGGAGTGKTVVALHRARQLAAKGKRVLL